MSKEKIQKFLKNKNNIALYIILIIGVAMMICGGGHKDKTADEKNSEVIRQNDEERLCDILGEIEGVGDVSVMITYFESEKKDIAYEVRESENKRDSSGSGEKTVDRQAVMSDGTPMVVKEVYPEVKGVIVVAQGAENVRVRENISTAVQAVMNVAAHRVCVYEKK